jgi:hypothetical protein
MQWAKAVLLALALLGACALPAYAEFYRLEGRFECLNDPAATCTDAASVWPVPQPARPATPDRTPSATPPAQAAPTPPLGLMPQPAAAADPVGDISARVEAGKATPGDILVLRRAASGGERRALELLAWCNVKGLGTRRDPIQAYLLYGAAASVGISNARQNQAAVYEKELTPEQRQQALMIENSVVLPQ